MDIPLHIISSSLYFFVSYFCIGFSTNPEIFFLFWLVLLLVSLSATGLGYLIASILHDAKRATIIGPVCLLPFLLVGGLLINLKDLRFYLLWLKIISPIRYGFEALMSIYWIRIKTIPCPMEEKSPFHLPCLKTGREVLETQFFDGCLLWYNIMALLVLSLLFRFLSGVVLWVRFEKIEFFRMRFSPIRKITQLYDLMATPRQKN